MSIIDLLSKIPEGALVVAETTDQERILQEYAKNRRLLPFRLKHPLDFSPWYAPDLLLTLKEHYGRELDITLNFLPCLPFIKEETAGFSERLRAAYDLKTKLIALDKADYSPLESLRKEDVFHIGFAHLDYQPRNLTRIDLDLDKEGQYSIVACQDNRSQADYAYFWASNLLSEGVLPEAIVIVNPTPGDCYQLHKLFSFAKIPFIPRESMRMIQQPLAIRFLDTAKIAGINTAVEMLKGDELDKANDPVIRELIAIINKYGIDLIQTNLDILEREIARAKYQLPPDRRAITTMAKERLVDDPDKHFLVLNATESIFSSAADNQFFTEAELEILGMESESARKLRLDATLTKRLRKITNLTLAYPRSDRGMASVAAKLDLERPQLAIDRPSELPAAFYSRDLERLRYHKLRYQKETYGVINQHYNAYLNEFQSEYQPYDYQFKGITESTSDRLLQKKINLSATSLKLFQECPFHYLLDQLLRISPKETSNAIYFGNLTHAVMENIFSDKLIDLEAIIASLKTTFPADISYKRELFMECFKREIGNIIPYFQKFARSTTFKEYGHEWQHSYTHEHNPRFVVLGKIDRILVYEKGDETYYAVIDYKTGNKEANKEEFLSCADIQLPFYLLLLYKADATASFNPFGFYYQKALIGRYNAEKNTDPIAKQLLFSGMTLSDSNLISAFGGENWLKGVNVNTDGSFSKRSRVLTAEEFKQIITTMESLIETSIRKIIDGKFLVKPLPLKPNQNLSESCKYCPYRSICNLPSVDSQADEEEVGEADE